MHLCKNCKHKTYVNRCKKSTDYIDVIDGYHLYNKCDSVRKQSKTCHMYEEKISWLKKLLANFI